MELIDRGDVLGVISCFFEDSFIEDADVNCAELEREINRLPTIDAVPVVRCVECFNQPGCQFAQYQGNSGYCSLGERRDKNG